MNSILNFLFDCYTLSPYKRGRPNIKSVNKYYQGRMGSECILRRLAEGIGFDWLKTGSVTSCCECVDELSGSGATESVSSE
jgi:hypothetical protein